VRKIMRVSDIAELLLLAALWGGSFLFMRIAAPVLGPVWLIELRVLLAGLALLPIVIRLGLWQEMRQKTTPLLVMGGINSALPFLLLAFASISLPAGFTSILNATTPLFSLGVAFYWLKESLTLNRAIGVVLGLAGVVVLVGWKPLASGSPLLAEIVAGLLAALMYALAAAYAKQHLSGVSAVVAATGSQLGAAILLFPLLPFTVPHTSPSTIVILAVIGLAFLSTSLTYILYFRLIKTIGSTRALTVTYLIPLFAMFWGAMVLQEPVTPSMGIGCGLILLGTAIANNLFASLAKAR
jgi:drug/metabolite transporter (DMT)-like permease